MGSQAHGHAGHNLLHRIAPHCYTGKLRHCSSFRAKQCTAGVIPSPRCLLSSVQLNQWITHHLPSYLLELVLKVFFFKFLGQKHLFKRASTVSAGIFLRGGTSNLVKVIVSQLQKILISPTQMVLVTQCSGSWYEWVGRILGEDLQLSNKCKAAK